MADPLVAPPGSVRPASVTGAAGSGDTEPFPPIGGLAFLSDGEVLALLGPGGTVEWMCLPAPDSPSVFGTLLDRAAGRFRVGPPDVAVPAGQRYLLASMAVETTWMTPTGMLVVQDALTLGPWRHDVRSPGQRRPPRGVGAEHVLLRTVECVSGSVEVTMDCEPMFDYGRSAAAWSYAGPGYGAATTGHGDVTLRLVTSLRLGFEGGRAGARATLRASERAFVALGWGDADPPTEVDEAFRRMQQTSEHWRNWVSTGAFPDHPWRDHLHRSALTLKALTYAPTGAMAAAATTSLPRVAGGSRNWDHRYSFVRDSASGLRALYALGFAWEADDFLSFLTDVTGGERPLQNLYRVTGDDPPSETELSHLTGYCRARPVRAGNAAVSYAQHDAFGALLDAAAVHARVRRRLSSSVWAMVRRQIAVVLERWREPDQGIWSVRGDPRHFTTSKVMAWVAVERGARVADLRGRPDLAADWRAVAAAITADVLEHGVSERGCFKEHYESDRLDASLLLLPLVGFLPGSDERVRATVFAVADELTEGGVVLRHRPKSGRGGEGQAFTVCSWWLVGALVTIGELDRARALTERLLTYGSRHGLYAEHLDPGSARQYGNFPHALTHLALVDALLRLIRASPAHSDLPIGRL